MNGPSRLLKGEEGAEGRNVHHHVPQRPHARRLAVRVFAVHHAQVQLRRPAAAAAAAAAGRSGGAVDDDREVLVPVGGVGAVGDARAQDLWRSKRTVVAGIWRWDVHVAKGVARPNMLRSRQVSRPSDMDI